MKYLVCDCCELLDQYECDVVRTPICGFNTAKELKNFMLTTAIEEDIRLFEVWESDADGFFELIIDYDDSRHNDEGEYPYLQNSFPFA